ACVGAQDAYALGEKVLEQSDALVAWSGLAVWAAMNPHEDGEGPCAVRPVLESGDHTAAGGGESHRGRLDRPYGMQAGGTAVGEIAEGGVLEVDDRDVGRTGGAVDEQGGHRAVS